MQLDPAIIRSFCCAWHVEAPREDEMPRGAIGSTITDRFFTGVWTAQLPFGAKYCRHESIEMTLL